MRHILPYMLSQSWSSLNFYSAWTSGSVMPIGREKIERAYHTLPLVNPIRGSARKIEHLQKIWFQIFCRCLNTLISNLLYVLNFSCTAPEKFQKNRSNYTAMPRVIALCISDQLLYSGWYIQDWWTFSLFAEDNFLV